MNNCRHDRWYFPWAPVLMNAQLVVMEFFEKVQEEPVCDILSFTTLRLNKPPPLTSFFLTDLPSSSQFIFTSSRLRRKFFHSRQKQIHLAIKHPSCALHEHETSVRSMFIISGCKACIRLSISVINDFRCSIHAHVINMLFH